MSLTSTFSPSRCNAMAVQMVDVVLPTPPFIFAIVMILRSAFMITPVNMYCREYADAYQRLYVSVRICIYGVAYSGTCVVLYLRKYRNAVRWIYGYMYSGVQWSSVFFRSENAVGGVKNRPVSGFSVRWNGCSCWLLLLL